MTKSGIVHSFWHLAALENYTSLQIELQRLLILAGRTTMNSNTDSVVAASQTRSIPTVESSYLLTSASNGSTPLITRLSDAPTASDVCHFGSCLLYVQ